MGAIRAGGARQRVVQRFWILQTLWNWRATENGSHEEYATLRRQDRLIVTGSSYTARTTALTGFEPTGITVNSDARRSRFLVMAPTRSTLTSPDLRFSTNAY